MGHVRGGQSLKYWVSKKEAEIAAPPGHGTWNEKLNREERRHSIVSVRPVEVLKR